jgi:Ca2+-binding RTX toxin-like protein
LDVSNVSQLDTAGFNVTVKQFYSPDGLGAVIGALTLSPAKNVIGGPVPLAFTDLSDDVDGCGGDFGRNIVPPGTANGIGDDNFFTNTTGTITVPAGGGTYVFTIGGDDGGRLRIDGQDVIVDDTFHGFVNRSSLPITLTAGAHTFEWVFFEGGGGACGELSYDNIATAQGRAVVGDNADGIVASNMQVTTYAKTRLDADFSRINQVLQNNLPADRIAGPTALAQTDLNDDVDGSGGDFGSNIVPPGLANGAGDDNFFVNTTGNFTVPAGGGPYVFTVGGDDGARLLIDGKVVIYDDTRHGFANFSSAPLTLAAGSHTFEWTFFEVGGGAGGELSYSNNGGTRVLLTNNAGGLTTSNVQATTWRWNPNAVPVQYFADNYAQANALATGVTPARLTVPAAAGMINMNNDPNASSCCFFPNDSGVPGVADGADNTVIEATGLVYIPAAGDWTFGFNSDDGFGMTIGGGATLGTITNGPGSNGSAGFLAYDGNRGQGTATLGVYTFPAAGFYPIRVVMWERGGGFNLELFSAPGSQTAFNAAIFDLVGDTPAGGLAVVPSLTAADASATVTITVVGQNDAPVAGTVVGKTINEDQSVTFTMVGASDPDTGAVLTYLWDIDGNGTFESTTATNSITLTPAQLAALGIDGPYNVVNPVNNVRVQVRDDQNATSAVVTTRLTVNNVAPNASIAGPGGSGDPSDPFLGGRGQASSFTFTVDDPSLIDDQARLQYSIDWGDGNVEPFTPTVGTLAADGSFSIDRQHVYNNAGDFTITLTARDKDGGVGTATAVVRIQAVFIDENGTLVIGGTGGADRIILQNSSFGIQARINNVLYPALSPLNGLVQVYGAGGNDTISVSGAVSATFEFFGGDGNDYLTGGGLNDVLHGDAGDDRLLGGGGDDLLLGGDGKDTLNGGNGNDLLYGDADGNGDATGDFADFTIEEGMSPGNDLLKGDNGDDQLHGGGGRDTLYGGVGSDELFGGDDADYLSGDAGDDLLMGEDGSDSMYGQAGNDVMIGGMLMDTLYGGAGSDLLLGDDLDVDSSLQLFAVWMQTATSDLDAARAFTSSASDDSGADNLSGQGGDDWFIAFLSDRVRDGKSSTDHLDKDGISVY